MQSNADLFYRCVCFDGIDDGGHGVFVTAGGELEFIERIGDRTIVASSFDMGESLELVRADGFVDLENVVSAGFLFHRIFVNTDDRLLATLNGLLVLVSRFLYLALWKADFDRLDHAAKIIYLIEIIHAPFDHLFRE